MKRFFVCILPLFLLLGLLGCSGHDRVESRLDAIDSLLSIPPAESESTARYDSLLLQLDSLQEAVFGDDDLTARWNLLCTMAEDKAERPLLLDLRIRPAYDYYSRATQDGTRGDSTLLHRLALSCLYMGKHYSLCDSTAHLEQMLQKSVDAARRIHDHYTAYLALTYLSNQIRLYNTAEAIRLSEDALSEYRQSGHHSPYNEICLLLAVGQSYFYGEISNRDKALDYYEQALKCSLANDSVLMETVYSYMAYYYIYRKNLSRVHDLFQKIMPLTFRKKDKYSIGLYANLYMGLDSVERAREYIHKLLPLANKTEKFYGFQCLQRLALRQHEYAEAYSLNDSLRQYAEAMCAEKSRNGYELYKENLARAQQNEHLKRKSITERASFIVAVVILLFAASLVALLMRQRIKRREKYAEIERMRKQFLSAIKDRELKSLAQEVSWRNEKLELLKSHLIQQSDVVERLQSVDSSTVQFCRLSDKDWCNLEVTLDEAFDNFASRLRSSYPSLGEEGFRLCMLQKLHLTNRQMANVFVLEQESVSKRKQRLKKILSSGDVDHRSFDEIVETL